MLKQHFVRMAVIAMILIVTTLLLLPTPGPGVNTAKSDHQVDLLISNARLFNGLGFTSNMDIAVKDGKVIALGSDLSVDADQIIDANNNAVIPGLIDAHTHTFGDGLKQTLNFGVMTHIDMFTPPNLLPQESKSATTGEAFLHSAGMLATVDGGHGTQFGIAIDTLQSPEDAKPWVTARKSEGSQFIKLVYMPDNPVFNSLDRATAEAVIDESHAQGLLAVAHISDLAGARDMLNAGIDGLVHQFADAVVDDAFLEQAKKQGLFVIPTLTVIATAAKADPGNSLVHNPLVKPFLNQSHIAGLQAGFGSVELPGFDLDIAIDNTRRMHAAGIPMLAGSDAPNPGTSYGISLHQEMQFLRQSGLSMEDTLSAATSLPASLFGLSDYGVIKTGAIANLIVLNTKLNTINESLDIAHIVHLGRVIERTRYDNATEENIPRLLSGQLSSFKESLTGENGLAWGTTDDQMANGQSVAKIEREDGTLKISGEVRTGFMFPWAGASIFTEQVIDLSSFRTLSFAIRGKTPSFQVMAFNPAQAGAPPSQSVSVSEDWQTVTLNLEEFRGFNPTRMAGFAFVAGPQTGEFEVYLDNVKLE